MATVWAHRIGNYVQNPASGWSHTVSFSSLKDLNKFLSDKNLKGQVTKLAIVAHGDAEGLVQLEQNLTIGTLASFADGFRALAEFLQKQGLLIFFSCLAGKGEKGSELLKAISKYLPQRYVVGFTVMGALPQEGLPSTPGQIKEVEYGGIGGMPAKWMKDMRDLTEQSFFAKWAQDGEIVRLPLEEQMKRPGYRCAWKNCPGHASPKDRCWPHVP